MPTDGFWVTIIGFADEPQSIRGQQPTVASVTAELFVIGNLLLGECLFHNRPPYKNNRAVPAFRLHRKSSFYTAKAHFLIIPARCIKYAKIISIIISSNVIGISFIAASITGEGVKYCPSSCLSAALRNT